jgi:DinB family protein
MPLPSPVESLWNELQTVRAEIIKEVAGLSQAQADWRPSAGDWSVGEIIHHLTLAEVSTGKLTSKLFKDAGSSLPSFPGDLAAFSQLPPWPPGPAEAPPVVRPESGHRWDELLSTFQATRDRSRQSIERLATADPRRLKWSHGRLGELDLAQWWMLQAHHDADHLRQLRAVKAAAGFPTA